MSDEDHAIKITSFTLDVDLFTVKYVPIFYIELEFGVIFWSLCGKIVQWIHLRRKLNAAVLSIRHKYFNCKLAYVLRSPDCSQGR